MSQVAAVPTGDGPHADDAVHASRCGELSVRRYGDAGDDEFAPQGGTIPQRLLMMNGKLVGDKLHDPLVFNAAARIDALASTPAGAVDAAYLALLTRRPTPTEREHFVARLTEQSSSDRRAAIEDLFWALFNSTEFAWNH